MNTTNEIHFENNLRCADHMKKKFDYFSEKQVSIKNCSICQVPARIRHGKEVCYEPFFVSIGPYHRSKQHLQTMEECKWSREETLLMRKSNNVSFHDLVDKLESLEMLLIDSCFIIHFFLKFKEGGDDRVSSWNWFSGLVMEDLIMLENQIPFFVVEATFKLVTCNENCSDFSSIAAEMLRWAYDSKNEQSINVDDSPQHFTNVKHLLDLCYKCVFPIEEYTSPKTKSLLGKMKAEFISCSEKVIHGSTSQTTIHSNHPRTNIMTKGNNFQLAWPPLPTKEKATIRANILCATKLVEAGVIFKETTGKRITDITFENGVLSIPPISIHESTKTLLANIVAWEQISNERRHISDHVQFMDLIINTSTDVAILFQSGIILTAPKSNEETARLFNDLGEYVYLHGDDKYRDLYDLINDFCEWDWHQYIAKLKRDYFSNPWATLSLTAAIVLLILTFLQTFYSVYGYYNPRI